MSPSDTDPIVGTWQLVSFVSSDPELATTDSGPLGPKPTGLLIYTSCGHMSVIMMRDPSFVPEASGHAAYMSYGGTWRRDGDDVIHRIVWAADTAWIGTDQPRRAQLLGSRLRLSGRGLTGERRPYVLEWTRPGDLVQQGKASDGASRSEAR